MGAEGCTLGPFFPDLPLSKRIVWGGPGCSLTVGAVLCFLGHCLLLQVEAKELRGKVLLVTDWSPRVSGSAAERQLWQNQE